jgi:methyl-accepting chemotaxis protein PixJ
MNNMNVAVTLVSTYDMRLVLLSYVIAVFASYTALDLAGRVTTSQGSRRNFWWFGGACAMGVGIWSMHFVAMLAFSLSIPISYDIGITLASMVAGIIASGIALFVVSRKALSMTQLILGGILMGAGIGAMHYTGMAAMRMAAKIWYDPTLFAISIVVAVTVSIVALWLAFHLRGESGTVGNLQKMVSALVIGGAIVGMNFTGQAATNFTPINAGTAFNSEAYQSGNSWLAIAIGIATSFILGAVLLSSLYSKHNAAPTGREASALR